MSEENTRQKFREECLKRDKFSCVVCHSKDDLVVHHIIERKLWKCGGYLKNNGATLCPTCHISAEETLISCEDLRKFCGITEITYPDHIDKFDKIDKWGNVILSNGKRVAGELFEDKSVQKILSKVLHYFIPGKYYKAPRTSHLPWSASKTTDDRTLTDVEQFLMPNKIVATLKMDGESTSLYTDHIHARSLDSDNHVSRNWIKNFHAQFAHDIPKGWRIVGENLYAKHSIYYRDLPTYFMVHSIWNSDNMCLSWRDTCTYCILLGLHTAPLICEGEFKNIETLRSVVESRVDLSSNEGYVIRVKEQFHYKDYLTKVGKYVRKNHVSTPHNWRNLKVEPNHLDKKAVVLPNTSDSNNL